MAAWSPSSFTIGLADGRMLPITSTLRPEGQPVRITPVARIEPRFFDACPICLATATDAEHVPPASMGGRVMTRTCGPCNKAFGSKVEADLADWHRGALTQPKFSAPVVQGVRSSARILQRITPEGEFVLIVHGNVDSAVTDMLESGQVDLCARLPDVNLVRLGLLKHAFLAACLEFGALEGPEADAVRVDLIAARDAPKRKDVPRSQLALGLTVLRSDCSRLLGWPVVSAIAEMDDERIEGVVLGGTTFVSWSSELGEGENELPRLTMSLAVGDPLEGVVVPTSAPERRTGRHGRRQ